jgi:NhaP-type Na+/H+ or K+/H+ antiporter
MRGTSFWTVIIFLMEAAVFVLIGLSLRDVVERGGGFGVVLGSLGGPALAFLVVIVLAAVAAGRRELIRLHRTGKIDDETLQELERDLDLEELSAISAKA